AECSASDRSKTGHRQAIGSRACGNIVARNQNRERGMPRLEMSAKREGPSMSVIRTSETQSATHRMLAARKQRERRDEEFAIALGIIASFYPGSHLAESKRFA